MFLHYLTQKSGIIGSSDVSEIAIVFSYVCYIILYVKVMKMKKENMIRSNFKGIICPILGIIGSTIILVGGIVSNPLYVPIFMLICAIVGAAGYFYYSKKAKLR
jgi:APA family basic amino acid/polyamine antiporter